MKFQAILIIALLSYGCANNRKERLKRLEVTGNIKITADSGKFSSIHKQAVLFINVDKKREAIDLLESICSEALGMRNMQQSDVRVLGALLKLLVELKLSSDQLKDGSLYSYYRLGLMVGYGSALEVHDSLLSLSLVNKRSKHIMLSEIHLTESIRSGRLIQDPTEKARALALSYGELGKVLLDLKDFKASEKAHLNSLISWRKIPKESQEKQGKILSAYTDIGKLYQVWSDHLKNQGKAYKDKMSLSKQAFLKVKELSKLIH